MSRLYHETLPYMLSTDIADFDFTRVHHWLSKEAYWSTGVPRNIVEQAFRHSLPFGLYHKQDGQIGTARVITDRAVFAYLADVFIDENYRGQGLARWMMETIMNHPELQGLRRFMLATKDMQRLYEKFGFMPVAAENNLMEISSRDRYK